MYVCMSHINNVHVACIIIVCAFSNKCQAIRNGGYTFMSGHIGLYVSR